MRRFGLKTGIDFAYFGRLRSNYEWVQEITGAQELGRQADASRSRTLFSLAPTTSKRLLRSYGCVSTCSSFQFQMNKKENVIFEFDVD